LAGPWEKISLSFYMYMYKYIYREILVRVMMPVCIFVSSARAG